METAAAFIKLADAINLEEDEQWTEAGFGTLPDAVRVTSEASEALPSCWTRAVVWSVASASIEELDLCKVDGLALMLATLATVDPALCWTDAVEVRVTAEDSEALASLST